MTERDDLPLPDYDHLPVGSLTSRIRTLDADDLQTLLDLRAGARQPGPGGVRDADRLTGAEGRRAALGRRPGRGRRRARRRPRPAGSQVSEATSGPPVNPPSHGDPTNPAQPRWQRPVRESDAVGS